MLTAFVDPKFEANSNLHILNLTAELGKKYCVSCTKKKVYNYTV